MSKMKTHKGTAKRFKKTASGKYTHQRAFHEHKLAHKSGKRRRKLRHEKTISAQDGQRFKKLLPYV